jgi:two-component system alkaline phosphatase synthesis response regulator PhoP
VELAAKEIPDLILMDVRMPRMSGYEACRRIKAEPSLQGVPIVFLSAKGQESEIRLGMEAGAEEYVVKPFAPAELVERVKQLLNKYG